MKLLSKLAGLLVLLCGVAVGSSAQGIAVNDQVLLSFSGNLKTVPGAIITVCTFGATGLPCNAPLTVYSNIALSTPIGTSVIADANGNFSYFIAPGTYTETQTAAGVTGRAITRTLACVSGATCTSQSGLNLTNPTPATNTVPQSSPILCFVGNYWTGSVSAPDTFCIQNIVLSGANPTTTLTLSHSGSTPNGGAFTLLGPLNVSTTLGVGTAGVFGNYVHIGGTSGSSCVTALGCLSFVEGVNVGTPTAGQSYIRATTSHRLVYSINGSAETDLQGPLVASLVTTAATTDNVTITGMTASGHCTMTPTNAAASGLAAVPYISNKTTNQITVTHSVTANANFDILCTPY